MGASDHGLRSGNPWGRRRHATRWLLLLLVFAIGTGWCARQATQWHAMPGKVVGIGSSLYQEAARFTRSTLQELKQAGVFLDNQYLTTPDDAQHFGYGDQRQTRRRGWRVGGEIGIQSLLATAHSGIDVWCHGLTSRLASVVPGACDRNQFRPSGFDSVNGQPIPVIDVDAKNPVGRVLLIGGTHGDELSAVSLVFWWLHMLEENGSDIDWRVAPLMNPDGLFHHPPQRVNAHGIDLNRNLPTPGWRKASRKYWQEIGRNPRRFPGRVAGSEPETRWLVSAIKRFRPDVIVSIHAPYGVLDYNGDFPPPEHLGHLPLHLLGVYPGSLGSYAWVYLGIPVLTIELQNAGVMPPRKQALKMWEQLNAWLNRYLQRPLVASADMGPAKG